MPEAPATPEDTTLSWPVVPLQRQDPKSTASPTSDAVRLAVWEIVGNGAALHLLCHMLEARCDLSADTYSCCVNLNVVNLHASLPLMFRPSLGIVYDMTIWCTLEISCAANTS